MTKLGTEYIVAGNFRRVQFFGRYLLICERSTLKLIIPNEVGVVKLNTAVKCHCWITGGISVHKLEHPSAVLYVDMGTSYYWLNRKGFHSRSRSCRGCGMNRLLLVSPLCLHQSSVYFLAITLGLQMALG